MKMIVPALRAMRRSAEQPNSEYAPLTYQQEWMRSLLASNNPLSFIARTYAWRLRGFIDLQVMRSSLEAVTMRHALLRTGIANDMGVPKLHMHTSHECRLEVVDLCKMTKSDAENDVRMLLEELACRPPTLLAPSSFEFRVMKISKLDHVLAVTMHHMFTDLTSLRVLLEELWRCYGDLLSNQPSAFQSAPIQYYEYSTWQRSTHHQWLASHEDYWATRLLGAKRFRLPVDSELSSIAPHILAEVREPLGLALTSAIVGRARREQTMTAMVVLASYAVVIRCWSHQRRLVIPFNVSGRHLPMHEAMLGPLGQMLLIRIDLSGAESLIDVLHLVGQEFSVAHEHLDFAKISMRFPELLESGFLQYLSWDPAELGGLPQPDEAESLPNPKIERLIFNGLPSNATIGYDTALQIVNTKEGGLCRLWYRQDLFTARRMREFVYDLRRVFEQFVVDPSVPVLSIGRTNSS